MWGPTSTSSLWTLSGFGCACLVLHSSVCAFLQCICICICICISICIRICICIRSQATCIGVRIYLDPMRLIYARLQFRQTLPSSLTKKKRKMKINGGIKLQQKRYIYFWSSTPFVFIAVVVVVISVQPVSFLEH